MQLKHHRRRKANMKRSIMLIAAQLLITFAVIAGLYVAWIQWWTGVQSEHEQTQMLSSVSWSNPGANGETLKIADAQTGAPPVEPDPATLETGDLIGEVYVPRFGKAWKRTLVQGTDLAQLNLHGLGHYESTQMPGQVGNFAIAGHRNGYGQPLGDIDELEKDDAIVVRTQNYWYVYDYDSYSIVSPSDVSVIAPSPYDPSAEPTARMMTLTTCEPKYSTPTHRWAAFATFKYWARVSDGIPQELAQTTDSGEVVFMANSENTSTKLNAMFARIGSLQKPILILVAAYVVLYIAAALIWRWPAMRELYLGKRPWPDYDIYQALMRHQPGPDGMRWILMILLCVAAALAMLQWVFPWAASVFPWLRQMSNYATV